MNRTICTGCLQAKKQILEGVDRHNLSPCLEGPCKYASLLLPEMPDERRYVDVCLTHATSK